jgi:hypothetical protein
MVRPVCSSVAPRIDLDEERSGEGLGVEPWRRGSGRVRQSKHFQPQIITDARGWRRGRRPVERHRHRRAVPSVSPPSAFLACIGRTHVRQCGRRCTERPHAIRVHLCSSVVEITWLPSRRVAGLRRKVSGPHVRRYRGHAGRLPSGWARRSATAKVATWIHARFLPGLNAPLPRSSHRAHRQAPHDVFLHHQAEQQLRHRRDNRRRRHLAP